MEQAGKTHQSHKQFKRLNPGASISSQQTGSSSLGWQLGLATRNKTELIPHLAARERALKITAILTTLCSVQRRTGELSRAISS